MKQSTDQPQRLADADRVAAVEHSDCCIVGGGPGGAVLALLLARQGVAVTLLEAHGDFNRDFRGDALQPAVLDVLGQMGLADRVLKIAIARMTVFPVHSPSETVALDDVGHLKTPYPFITMVPQVRFLDLIVSEASAVPTSGSSWVPASRPWFAMTTDTSAVCATGPKMAGMKFERS